MHKRARTVRGAIDLGRRSPCASQCPCCRRWSQQVFSPHHPVECQMSDLSVSHPCHRVPARRGECASPPIAHRSSRRRVTRSSRTRTAATSGRSAARASNWSSAFDASRTLTVQRLVQPGHRPRPGYHAGAGIQHHRRRRARHVHVERRRRLRQRARRGHRPRRHPRRSRSSTARSGCCITRVYACYPESPTIETWTRIAAPTVTAPRHRDSSAGR